jgi:hypothetical protein
MMGFPFGIDAGLDLCAYASLVGNDDMRRCLAGGFTAGFGHCFKRRVGFCCMAAKRPGGGDWLTAGGWLNGWRSWGKAAWFATNFAVFAS